MTRQDFHHYWPSALSVLGPILLTAALHLGNGWSLWAWIAAGSAFVGSMATAHRARRVVALQSELQETHNALHSVAGSYKGMVEMLVESTRQRFKLNEKVEDVAATALERPDFFKIEQTSNVFGGREDVVRMTGAYEPDLSAEEQASLSHVIERTSSMKWDDFVRLVYSTYPALTQPQYSFLDLEQLAEEYGEEELTPSTVD